MKIKKANLIGSVGCISSNIINNYDDLNLLFDTKTQNVIKATGIESKSIVGSKTTALDLSLFAAKELLNRKGINPQSIGVLINVSFTQEHTMPGDAPKAQYKLGLNKNILAFDIDMACSGYIYGFYLASLLANIHKTNVLLLNGDTQSKFISRFDKSTLPVMADAGSSTLIGPCNSQDDWYFSFYSNGENANALYIPDGGSRFPITSDSITYRVDKDGNKRRNIDIFMDGFEIYKFVAQEASTFIQDFMNLNSISESKIDKIVFHQANIYMIKQLTKKLNLPLDKLIITGDKYGNTSSSSVPLAISSYFKDFNSTNSSKRLLMSGFGGGLSIGCAYIDFTHDTYFDVLKYKEEY